MRFLDSGHTPDGHVRPFFIVALWPVRSFRVVRDRWSRRDARLMLPTFGERSLNEHYGSKGEFGICVRSHTDGLLFNGRSTAPSRPALFRTPPAASAENLPPTLPREGDVASSALKSSAHSPPLPPRHSPGPRSPQCVPAPRAHAPAGRRRTAASGRSCGRFLTPPAGSSPAIR